MSETITTAAIQVEGRTFTGNTHGGAFLDANQALGRFVDAQEATRIVNAAEQPLNIPGGKLHPDSVLHGSVIAPAGPFR